MKKTSVWAVGKVYGAILLGCAAYALSFNWCFQPNNLSMGGFTGIAQIIHYYIPVLPVGLTSIALNIPLFYIGVRKLGFRLLVNSLIAMSAGSLLIDALAMCYTFSPMDPLLSCIYGGAMLGFSMGLLLRVETTTGGTELAARLLKLKLKHLPIGRLCMCIDVAVIVVYALTFREVNNALYGIVAMYISSLAMDMIVYGSASAKMAYIISAHSEAVAQKLLTMNLGLTLLNGEGGFTGDRKKVILCAFKRNQIVAIKEAVTLLDPDAFIIVCDAHEILGEGFGVYTPDGL